MSVRKEQNTIQWFGSFQRQIKIDKTLFKTDEHNPKKKYNTPSG